MPGTEEARDPQRMLGLRLSSSQAASGIQFPPGPTRSQFLTGFLSSFAILTQVHILKKAAGLQKTTHAILTLGPPPFPTTF